MALLVAVGVAKSGYRELLAVEAAVGEKAVAYQGLLRGLIDGGLRGVRLVISDDHEGIKAAVEAELPGTRWQRCVVHFERNVLAEVPAHAQVEVAGDLKEIFVVSRREKAEALAQAFMARWGKKFPKAMGVFERGMEEALVYLDFPREQHRGIRRRMARAPVPRDQAADTGDRGLPE